MFYKDSDYTRGMSGSFYSLRYGLIVVQITHPTFITIVYEFSDVNNLTYNVIWSEIQIIEGITFSQRIDLSLSLNVHWRIKRNIFFRNKKACKYFKGFYFVLTISISTQAVNDFVSEQSIFLR